MNTWWFRSDNGLQTWGDRVGSETWIVRVAWADHLGAMSRATCPNRADLPPPSVQRMPRPSRGDGWNTLADIEAFVFAVEAESQALDRERAGVHRRGRRLDHA